MNKTFCKKCGAKIPSEGYFCPRCGQHIQIEFDGNANSDVSDCTELLEPQTETNQKSCEESDANKISETNFFPSSGLNIQTDSKENNNQDIAYGSGDDQHAEEQEQINHIFCKKCGAKMPSEVDFCPGCGQRVKVDTDEIDAVEASERADEGKRPKKEESANTKATITKASFATKFNNLVQCLWGAVIVDVFSSVSDWADTPVGENAIGCIFMLLFIWLTLAVTLRKSWARKLYVCCTTLELLLILLTLAMSNSVVASIKDIGTSTFVVLAIQLYCTYQLLMRQEIKLVFEPNRNATGSQADANRLSCILWVLICAITFIGYCAYVYFAFEKDYEEAYAEEYINNLYSNIDNYEIEADDEGELTNSTRTQIDADSLRKLARPLAKFLTFGVICLFEFLFNKQRAKSYNESSTDEEEEDIDGDEVADDDNAVDEDEDKHEDADAEAELDEEEYPDDGDEGCDDEDGNDENSEDEDEGDEDSVDPMEELNIGLESVKKQVSDLKDFMTHPQKHQAEDLSVPSMSYHSKSRPAVHQATINDEMTKAPDGGQLLAGRFRIVKPLGQGGMGSVWLVEDTLLDGKRFAVKMLPSILASNKRAYRQLKDEALVAMKLVHPNIVQIRAFEENGGNPFLVMDYIEGQTLDDYLTEHAVGRVDPTAPPDGLSESEALSILKPVAAALDYAHEQGVVHRDIKPGNVMIRTDGHPFILDFGIAREIQDTMTRLTGKLSSGTLLYMSPEQLRGKGPKPAQDVYSFAIMAYECLRGEPPFTRGQIEFQILNEQPESLAGRDGVSAPLTEGIMSALAKKPEDRPATCMDVLNGNISRRSTISQSCE